MKKPGIPSFLFRRRAWKVIKPMLQVLVVLGLLMVLPSYVSTIVVERADADPLNYLADPMQDMLEFSSKMQQTPLDITVEEEQALWSEFQALMTEYSDALITFGKEKGGVYFGMMAMTMLLTPIFSAPLYGTLLDAQRKKQVTLNEALGKLRHGPKMLLLNIWMALRVWAWMLPGMGLYLLGLVGYTFVPQLSALTVEGPAGELLNLVAVLLVSQVPVLLLAGIAGMVVLGGRAMLHYIMAPIALMDHPELSLNGCIRVSYQIMRRRKRAYFALRFSFVLWYLLLSMLTPTVGTVVTVVIGLTVSMMGEMLLTVYVSGAEVVFYDAFVIKEGGVGDLREILSLEDDKPEDGTAE